MRISLTCIIALSVLALGARSARAEEYIEVCPAVVTVAERVALRSDGAIGYAGTKYGGQIDADYGIVYNWSELKDYNPNGFCNPFGVEQDVIKMCQEFLAANAPDECPSELENTKKTVINQSKQIRRLARENKRLRDLLKRPRPFDQAKR
jgi:hypothetical protein